MAESKPGFGKVVVRGYTTKESGEKVPFEVEEEVDKDRSRTFNINYPNCPSTHYAKAIATMKKHSLRWRNAQWDRQKARGRTPGACGKPSRANRLKALETSPR